MQEIKLGKAFFLEYTSPQIRTKIGGARVTRSQKASAEKKIVFQHFAPGALEVKLAGSFNGWKAASTPLNHEGEGKWKVTLSLPPGRYEYRYWVDGDWQNEQKTAECVPNPFGTWNCVVEVK